MATTKFSITPKVLVLCATGKAGFNVCKALVDEGFEVHGTTRSDRGSEALLKIGVTAHIANYTTSEGIEMAIASSGAKLVWGMNDLIGAAKGDVAKANKMARDMIDTCKRADLDHFCLMTVIGIDELDQVDERSKHIYSNAYASDYLKESAMKSYSVLQPAMFMENFNDKKNFNPLKKGSLKMLCSPDVPCKWVACYDIGKMAALHFSDPAAWHGKSTHCGSVVATVNQAGEALTAVTGTPTKCGMMMPRCIRRLMIPADIEAMISQFEGGFIPASDIDAFKALVPDAMDFEAWFRYIEVYSNGAKIAAAK